MCRYFFFILVLLFQNLHAQKSIRELILSTSTPILDSTKKLTVDKREDLMRQDANGVDLPCYLESWSEVVSFDDLISLNPNNNTIYPGAAIQGRSLRNGSLDNIPLKRSGGTLTLSGLNFSDSILNSVYVRTATESNIKEGIRKLIFRKNPSTDSYFSHSISKIKSIENGLTRLGLSANWLWGSLSSQLSSADFSSKNVYVVKLVQRYYSISFSDPPSPEDIFSRRIRLRNASLYMGKDNPPVLITNVNYGRIFILIIETSENDEIFSAVLNASFGLWSFGGGISFSEENRKRLEQSKIQLFAVGGDSKQISEVITASQEQGKTEKLKAYIEKGANFSFNSTGVPISYKAIYLSNNHVAAVNSASEFKTVTCIPKPYRKPVTVTVNKLVARDVGDGTDDDEDMEIWYKIEFLDESNQLIDVCENKKSETYVEEPTKVGGENSSNTFFVNENPKTVNKPVFKIKCTVGAKSYDGDGAPDWGERGSTTSVVFDATNFDNVKIFKAWDRLDLYLTIK